MGIAVRGRLITERITGMVRGGRSTGAASLRGIQAANGGEKRNYRVRNSIHSTIDASKLFGA
jgi:hypothetical protein